MTEAFSTPPAFTNITPESSDSPWSHQGRFGRMSYFAWNMVLGFIIIGAVILFAIVGAIIGTTLSHGILWVLIPVGCLVLIPLIYFMIVFQIRRLHDVNRTGWWAILPFADNIISQVFTVLFHSSSISLVLGGITFIINIAFTLYLMIAKGTEGTNSYGSQRTTPEWEKVLGWIYIVLIPIAFIGVIFAAIAIPAYQDYTKRAHTVEHPQLPISQSTNEISTSTLSENASPAS